MSRGRVQILSVHDAVHQAEAVVDEIRRLRGITPFDWSAVAVLSSEHRDLSLVRAVLEREGIPLQWRADRGSWPNPVRVREVHEFLERIEQAPRRQLRIEELGAIATELRQTPGTDNPWLVLVDRLVAAWQDEAGDVDAPAVDIARFCRETLAQLRRDADTSQGVVLSTVHAAKGTEYDHVFVIGNWWEAREVRDSEERRRAFYVGMTRARQSLTLLDLRSIRPSLPGQLISPEFACRTVPPIPIDPRITHRNYALLSLADIFLSYAGRQPEDAPIHRALASLRPGHRVLLRSTPQGSVEITTSAAIVIARLSANAAGLWTPRIPHILEARVLAVLRRFPNPDNEAEDVSRLRCASWEIPLLELVWEDPPAGRHA
jgi:ATP-dependent DNA helicase RecQ